MSVLTAVWSSSLQLKVDITQVAATASRRVGLKELPTIINGAKVSDYSHVILRPPRDFFIIEKVFA